MLHVFNCYVPWGVFTLAELRAGLCHVVLLIPWGLLFLRLDRRSWWNCVLFLGYTAGMFFFQRRLASGLPLRFASLRSWRTSPDNYRKTSSFLRSIKAKQCPAKGVSAEGYGERPVVVITGGERGIGRQVVEQLLREKMDVILCCPFEAVAQQTIQKLKARIPGAVITFLKLNLNDEDSVRESAASILRMTPRIDVLINNAGMVNIAGYKANRRGNEVVLAINFLGHVLLTELLLDRVQASGPSRIVNVASLMQLNACIPGPCRTPLDALVANCDPNSAYHTSNYSLSKLLFICYTRDLARRLQGTSTKVVSLHPGVVLTNIYSFGAIFMKLLLRTVFKFPGEGAEVVLCCALAPNIESGSFYADFQQYDSVLSPLALDDAHNERLRRVLLRYFGLDHAPLSTMSLSEVAAATP
ncbi:dehydrogenase-like protein [Leptomonas pyrrhocoris]|uniref:Dehydrogenase-like protein n=1 Tax=Leptomonas pyrrhocoris TaxID=157538 RepID=A0A0N0VDK6_LEPPY|nr:dehydrogenase-like protein [Leptomonas pyrrhocoris]KPA75878.1 dehydrogenase-like protein [Leptomonas pyrrhocoris]|eukprot:XP_015654317.1 dehydrogenase-like protein [Leptomonas pyrrhocoris]